MMLFTIFSLALSSASSSSSQPVTTPPNGYRTFSDDPELGRRDRLENIDPKPTTLITFKLSPNNFIEESLYEKFERLQAQQKADECDRCHSIVHVSKLYDSVESLWHALEDYNPSLEDLKLRLDELNHKPAVIGIAGGMGPEAGALFLRETVKRLNSEDIDIILYSNVDGQPRANVFKWSAGTVLRMKFLADSRFKATIAASNTFHTFLYHMHEDIIRENRCFAWLLYKMLAGESADEVSSNENFVSILKENIQHLQSLREERGMSKIGNLATKHTYSFGFYNEVADAPENQENMSEAIQKMKAGNRQAAVQLCREVTRSFGREYNALFLGCTEVPLMISKSELEADGKHIVSSIDVGAQAVIDRAKNDKHHEPASRP